MRSTLYLLLFLLGLPSSVLAQRVWRAELQSGISIGAPICPGFDNPSVKKSSVFKLCVPSAVVRNLEVAANRRDLILKAPGAIQGPVLVNSTPPVILIGSMALKKGAINLQVKPSGGFQMSGVGGDFQIEGLIAPIPTTRSLEVDEIEFEFTSPDDARLKISAADQEVGVTLEVRPTGENQYHFIPSPPISSIFPQNIFFSEFDGERDDEQLHLRFLKNVKITLAVAEEE